MQQGKMFFFIGFIMAAVQGTYDKKKKKKKKKKKEKITERKKKKTAKQSENIKSFML